MSEELPENMLSGSIENMKRINSSIFPRIRSSNRLLNSKNTKEIMKENYDLSQLDYIGAVMHCTEEKILDLIPDSYSKHSTKRRRRRSGKEKKQNHERAVIKNEEPTLIDYNIFMKLAIETNNKYILEYFTRRYNFQFNEKHLNLAIRFGSTTCEEFMLRNVSFE